MINYEFISTQRSPILFDLTNPDMKRMKVNFSYLDRSYFQLYVNDILLKTVEQCATL